jgi:hypothetical protein
VRDSFSELDFNLRIAREDILMGVKKLFQAEQLNIEKMVIDAFKNVNVDRIIQSQIDQEINNIIRQSIFSYIKYGEGKKVLDSYIESMIKGKIENAVKNLSENL